MLGIFYHVVKATCSFNIHFGYQVTYIQNTSNSLVWKPTNSRRLKISTRFFNEGCTTIFRCSKRGLFHNLKFITSLNFEKWLQVRNAYAKRELLKWVLALELPSEESPPASHHWFYYLRLHVPSSFRKCLCVFLPLSLDLISAFPGVHSNCILK